MDAIQLLTADHNRVRGLFTRFKEAHEKDDTATAEMLVTKMVEELTVHTEIEEKVFYPGIKGRSEELDEVVAEGFEEHKVAKTLLEEIKMLDSSAEEWTAKVQVLIESVEHHAEEEETEMFKLVRKATDSSAREEMATRMEALKKEMGAPTSEDTIDLTNAELERKASEQQIPGRSKMSRDELALTIDPRG
jgi:hemerythrin superfamily protein